MALLPAIVAWWAWRECKRDSEIRRHLVSLPEDDDEAADREIAANLDV